MTVTSDILITKLMLHRTGHEGSWILKVLPGGVNRLLCLAANVLDIVSVLGRSHIMIPISGSSLRLWRTVVCQSREREPKT